MAPAICVNLILVSLGPEERGGHTAGWRSCYHGSKVSRKIHRSFCLSPFTAGAAGDESGFSQGNLSQVEFLQGSRAGWFQHQLLLPELTSAIP